MPTMSSMTAAMTSPPRGLGLDPTSDYNNVSIVTAFRGSLFAILDAWFTLFFSSVDKWIILLTVPTVGIAQSATGT
jgi:hypothetical protein